MKLIAVFLISMTLIGCSNKEYEATIQEQENTILELQKQNTKLNSEIIENKLLIADYKSEIDNIKKQLDNSSSNESILSGYYELEQQDFPRYMYLTNPISLKMFPYDWAEDIMSIFPMYLVVHTIVINDSREQWALVECTEVGLSRRNSFGYVPLNALEKREYVDFPRCSKESIGDIEIGDKVEEVIMLFGSDYIIYKTEFGVDYVFEDARVKIDPISNTVQSINIYDKGYQTKEGIEVGADIEEVKAIYGNNPEMEVSELYSNFPETTYKLEGRYIIIFNIEDNKVVSISITGMVGEEW